MSFYNLGDDASCVGKRARPLLFSDDGITNRLGKLKGSPLISVLVTSVEMIDLYTRAVSFLPLGLQCAVRDTVDFCSYLVGDGDRPVGLQCSLGRAGGLFSDTVDPSEAVFPDQPAPATGLPLCSRKPHPKPSNHLPSTTFPPLCFSVM